jgi:hypothetical protein
MLFLGYGDQKVQLEDACHQASSIKRDLSKMILTMENLS